MFIVMLLFVVQPGFQILLSVWGSRILGTSLTLTCSLIHGYGVYIYLGDEGIPSGANWTIEVVLWLSLMFGISNMHMILSYSIFTLVYLRS